MTEEQKRLLQQIIDELTTSCSFLNGLADPLFGLNEAYVKQAMRLADFLWTFLGQWEKLRSLANQVASAHNLGKGLQQIEALTLTTVLKTIESEITPLRNQSPQHIETLTIALQKDLLKEKPAQLAFKDLCQLCLDFHAVCDKEINSLKSLCTTAQVAPKAINQTPMLITGPVKIEKETIPIPQNQRLFEFELSSASSALCEMHNKYGIVAIKHINMTDLPISERELIYNAPLRLLGRYPLGICGRTVISSSICTHKLLASYTITKEKIITICFEQYTPSSSTNHSTPSWM